MTHFESVIEKKKENFESVMKDSQPDGNVSPLSSLIPTEYYTSRIFSLRFIFWSPLAMRTCFDDFLRFEIVKDKKKQFLQIESVVCSEESTREENCHLDCHPFA